MAIPNTAITRNEQYLAAMAGQSGTLPDAPITRKEHYLAKAAGQAVETPEPITREEMYLDVIAEGGGGGGGGEAVLIPKTFTENGTYAAADDGADGYDTVTVNVQGSDPYAIARSILDRSITEYVDDQLTRIEGSALSGASKLATLRCHAVTYIGNQGLLGTKCTALAFPHLTSMGITVFRSCNQLVAFDFGTSLASIPMQTFDGCSSLNVLVLRRGSVMGLANTNALSGTCFKSGGSGGTIYIPRSLYDHLGDGTNLDYKAATNWATYNGYGTITWAPIEGSIYETQYADGTPIS